MLVNKMKVEVQQCVLVLEIYVVVVVEFECELLYVDVILFGLQVKYEVGWLIVLVVLQGKVVVVIDMVDYGMMCGVVVLDKVLVLFEY